MNISRLGRWKRHVKQGRYDRCWPWQGATNKQGYGLFEWGGKPRRCVGAHRAGWLLLKGDLTPQQLVLHECDNPPCCNPSHWFIGDNQANTDDMMAKGRSLKGQRWGKLTDEVVRLIRADDRHSVVVAQAYGIAESYVRGIRRGRNKASVG